MHVYIYAHIHTLLYIYSLLLSVMYLLWRSRNVCWKENAITLLLLILTGDICNHLVHTENHVNHLIYVM